MKRWKKVLLGTAAAGVLVVACGWDYRIQTVTYRVEHPDITAPVRLAVVADVHCCDYGDELLTALEAAAPDAVLLPGDILDDTMPLEQGYALLDFLAARWPCFYVTGNHDAFLAEAVASRGVTVLDGTFADVTLKGQTLRICGVGDPRSESRERFYDKLTDLQAAAADFDGPCLLLAHRPDLIVNRPPAGFPVIVSGHAHGGQWRIPGLVNGLLAPGQGLFPQYAGGLYHLGGTAFVVSRGLAKESTRLPRLYNPPELVVIELT